MTNDSRVAKDHLLVSGDRVFCSLQGEGQSLGKPAVFLRLYLCNMRCTWCDTGYTWDKRQMSYLDGPVSWSIEETWAEIKKQPASRLVITGGEPLLQSDALDSLLDLIPSDWKLEVETNGTIPPSQLMIEREVQFNVSPKLASSGNEKMLRYKPEILRIFNQLSGSTFKFVVASLEDAREIESIVDECGLGGDRVILMPEGTTQRDIARHGRQVAAFCIEKGWRLLPRLHIMLWGHKRRV